MMYVSLSWIEIASGLHWYLEKCRELCKITFSYACFVRSFGGMMNPIEIGFLAKGKENVKKWH
jgi:hypothetical protein